MDLLGLARRQNQLKRLREIATVLARYGLADWVNRIPSAEIRNLLASPKTLAVAGHPWEERVRLALTDLGATFIKLGQMLSTRPDMVGVELARELCKLQADVPADSPGMVHDLIQAELGRPIGELFAEFEDKAFASASIGQVHKARLQDGSLVVVKVQHDGILERIRPDLELMAALAQVLDHYVAAVHPYRPAEVVTNFSRSLMRELDFTSEKRNLEEFARNFARDDTVRIPRVFPGLSSKRVLTMEMLVGVPGSNQAGMHSCGADLNEFSRRAACMYLGMIFRDGFYHADPHPGNYILLPGTVVGVIDFGMVGRISDGFRDSLGQMLIAVANRDAEELADILLDLCESSEDVNEALFRGDVSDFFADYAFQSVKDIQLAQALERLTEVIRRHKLLLPAEVSLLLKTLIMLDGSANELSPAFNLMEILDPFQRQMLRDRFRPKRWLGKWRRGFHELERVLGRAPRDIESLFRRLRSGRLEIKMDHRNLQAAVNRLVVGILTGALFLGSSLLWSRQIPPVLFGASLPGVLGCSAAVAMGLMILLAIRGDANRNNGE
jgi:ubiquinone biosynthesis protein